MCLMNPTEVWHHAMSSTEVMGIYCMSYQLTITSFLRWTVIYHVDLGSRCICILYICETYKTSVGGGSGTFEDLSILIFWNIILLYLNLSISKQTVFVLLFGSQRRHRSAHEGWVTAGWPILPSYCPPVISVQMKQQSNSYCQCKAVWPGLSPEF